MNYLGRKHGLMSNDLQISARTEAIVLGAEDMRMDYFRSFGTSDEALEKQAIFIREQWQLRWLPSWDELLEINGDNGFLAGDKLTQADVAVWDALDAITHWIAGADFKDYPRVEKFHDMISQRPGIERYLKQRK